MKVEVRKIENAYMLRWWEDAKPHGKVEREVSESCLFGVDRRLREIFGVALVRVDEE